MQTSSRKEWGFRRVPGVSAKGLVITSAFLWHVPVLKSFYVLMTAIRITCTIYLTAVPSLVKFLSIQTEERLALTIEVQKDNWKKERTEKKTSIQRLHSNICSCFQKAYFYAGKKIHVHRQICQCFQQKFWFLSRLFQYFLIMWNDKEKKYSSNSACAESNTKVFFCPTTLKAPGALHIVLGFEFAFFSPSLSIFRTHIMVSLNHVFPAFTLKCTLDVKTNSYISAMYCAIAELTTFVFNDNAQRELNVSENKVRGEKKKNQISLVSIVFTLILSSNKRSSIYHHLI